jgi:hypothetical protein
VVSQEQEVETVQGAAEAAGAFKGGWRPFFGWVCAAALAYNYLVREVLSWVAVNIGWSVPPALDLEQLGPLVLSVLGLAGYRTYERAKGKA